MSQQRRLDVLNHGLDRLPLREAGTRRFSERLELRLPIFNLLHGINDFSHSTV